MEDGKFSFPNSHIPKAIFSRDIFFLLLYILCGAIQQRTLGLLYCTVSVCNSDHVASILGLLVHNEMEINWKQAVVTSSKYYPEIFMDVLRKTMTRFNHNVRYSDRDSNRVSRAYKSMFITAKNLIGACLLLFITRMDIFKDMYSRTDIFLSIGGLCSAGEKEHSS